MSTTLAFAPPVAARSMIDAGVPAVYDMGGIGDWQAAGFPVVTG